jgi:plastocyanin
MVKTGTTVTWMNNDTVAHTVTSDSGGLLNSPEIAPGQSFSFTFTYPVTVPYHCAIHTMMKGTIVVEN